MSAHAPVDAIALITSATSRGTGFLVRASGDRRLVLTAGHVVDGGAPLTVTFPGRAALAATLASASPSPPAPGAPAPAPLLRGTSDWAALAVDPAAVADIDPIDLDDLDGPSDTPFDTYGFPNLYGVRGGALHGRLRRVPGGVEPVCYELQDKPTDRAEGISGGPCLVADAAIGIIKETLGWAGNITAGSLLIVPASTIVDESHGALARATDPDLPYQWLLDEPLKGLGVGPLRSMIKQLDLAEVAGQDTNLLRRRVVRGLLVATPDRIARALVTVRTVPDVRAAAARLLVLRETMWLHSSTVRGALGLAVGGGATAFDARLEVTARQLLRRASWCDNDGERWFDSQHCFVVSPSIDAPAAIVQAVEEQAVSQLHVADRAGFDKLLGGTRRVFAVLMQVMPRPATCAALAKEFPLLRVLFFGEPRPASDAAASSDPPWLVPAIAAGNEKTWRDDCTSARQYLRDNKVHDIPDDVLDLMDDQ